MALRKTILILILAWAFVAQARTYVVCVGVADYPANVRKLNVSDNDAKTIHAIFARNNLVVSTLLLNQSATIRNVCNEMLTLFARATASDQVILFVMVTVCVLIKLLKELAVIVFKVQESRHRYHKVPPGIPDFILDISLFIA